jgi:hypothetical protein
VFDGSKIPKGQINKFLKINGDIEVLVLADVGIVETS